MAVKNELPRKTEFIDNNISSLIDEIEQTVDPKVTVVMEINLSRPKMYTILQH